MLIETTRLIIREFTLEDDAFIIDLLNTPGWLRFIGDRNIKTTEDAHTYLQNVPLASYDKNGFGLWCVVLKENNTPIGMCGLIKRDTLEHIDIGFAFLPQYNGKGYAFEAAEATMQYTTGKLGIDHVVAITSTDNESSGKLLEKIGFRFERIIQFPDDEEVLKYYSNK